MIPILFGPTATEFNTNGLGTLADAVSCKVTEELNGAFELALTYPLTGKRFGDIQPRGIVLAKPSPYAAAQPFRIYDISKPMRGVITVHARHLSYDLSGIPVSPFTAGSLSAALNGLKSNAVVACPFTFQTDKSVSAGFSVAVPAAIRSLLGGQSGSVLDVYGGEYEWDGYTVKLLTRRGQDNGVSIRYGKNLTDLTQEENIANVATGVYPFWQSLDGRVVEAPGKIVNAPGTYNFVRILPLDLTGEFETEPTPEQLQTRAQTYVERNGIGVPAVSISVSFQPLEQTEEYRHLALLEKVQLGDTVTVEYPALGVSATARVAAAVYDVLLDRYERVQLGSVRSRLSTTITEQQKEIEQRPTLSASQRLTNTILGALGGAVRLLDTNGDGWPDTLYIANDPDPAKATKVWRYNYEGWAASTNGYNGPFVLGATLDDGLLADFITAGLLKSKDGHTYFDLDNDLVVAEGSNGLERVVLRGRAGALLVEWRETTDAEWAEVGSVYIGTSGKSNASLSRYNLGPYGSQLSFAYLDDDRKRRVLCEYLNVDDIWCTTLNKRISMVENGAYTMAPDKLATDEIRFKSADTKMAWLNGTSRVLESDEFYLGGYKLTMASDGTFTLPNSLYAPGNITAPKMKADNLEAGNLKADVLVSFGSSVTSTSWIADQYDFFIAYVAIGSNTSWTTVAFTAGSDRVLIVSDNTNYCTWDVTATGITQKYGTGAIKHLLGFSIT